MSSFRRVAACTLANVTVALPALPANPALFDLPTKPLAPKHWNTRTELHGENPDEKMRECQVQRILFVLQYPVALTLTAPARGSAPVALTLTAVTLTLTAPARGFALYEDPN